MENKRFYSLGVSVVLGLAMSFTQASQAATIISLNDGGSTAVVDLDSLSGGAGMNSWTVDTAPTQNQLNKQWFYYRVGGGLAQPINLIGALTYSNPDSQTLEATYTSSQFSLTIAYTLSGGGTGTGGADISENISVSNTSGAPLDFHLFQYSDFNLLGTPGGDSLVIGSPYPGAYNSAIQWEGSTAISESSHSPFADRAEAAVAFTTLNNLNTIPGYPLNNYLGPVSGDVTWSFQWDKEIGIGADAIWSKDKQMHIEPVPEPTAISMIAAAVVAAGFLRRRR